MALKYRWLENHLKILIKKNMENGIDKLPSEKELCSRYHVSRQTVRAALSLLEEEKLIVRKHGSGSYLTGLMTNQDTNTIALLLSSQQDYCYPALIDTLQNTFSQKGYHCNLYVSGNEIYREREILTSLYHQPPRGLIVEAIHSAFPNPNLDCYQQLKEAGCQILFLYNPYPDYRHSLYIKNADYQGSFALTKQLITQNHTHIGGIFLSDSLRGHERYAGFMEAMKQYKLPVKDNQICFLSTNELQLLRNYQQSPTLEKYVLSNFHLENEPVNDCSAFLCFNVEIAYGLCQEIHTKSNTLLSSVEIAAFDYNYLTHFRNKPFSTLASSQEDLGKAAANLMIQKLKGLPVKSQEIPWKLITI